MSGGDLYLHLRCQKQRRKRYGSHNRRGQIVDRISIDERPAIVDARSHFGDWELDTIIGKDHQQASVSLTERKSRYTLIHNVKRKQRQTSSRPLSAYCYHWLIMSKHSLQIMAKNFLNIKRLIRLSTPIFIFYIHMLFGSMTLMKTPMDLSERD